MYILSPLSVRHPKPAAALDIVRLFRPVELEARSISSIRTLCEPRAVSRGEPPRVIDSQSVKSAERPRSIRRYTREDQGKKRHILVDTQACDPAIVHAADIQIAMCVLYGDRVRPLSVPAETLRRWRLSGPGVPPRGGENHAQVNVEIVKRSDHAKGFVVLPKRWCGTNLAWLGRCRRLAKDWKISIERRSRSCVSPPSGSC